MKGEESGEASLQPRAFDLPALAYAYSRVAPEIGTDAQAAFDRFVYDGLLGRSTDLTLAFNTILASHDDPEIRKAAARNTGRTALRNLAATVRLLEDLQDDEVADVAQEAQRAHADLASGDHLSQ